MDTYYGTKCLIKSTKSIKNSWENYSHLLILLERCSTPYRSKYSETLPIDGSIQVVAKDNSLARFFHDSTVLYALNLRMILKEDSTL